MDTLDRLYALFRQHPQVSTDSRAVLPGSLFFALKGESFDGNRYAAGALAAGAAGAVVDDPAVVLSERYLLVDDVLQSLQALARHHRRTLGLPILAITGSNGKTTTKELIGRTLAQRYRVAVTRGNLNNHIGVPLTLLAMTADTEFGVVEMGANHCGEIALLCSIAEPDYGLITNIGKAHLEGFGGPEGVMRGKGEMLDYLLKKGGEAFYLQESEPLQEMVATRHGLRTIPYTNTDLTTLSEDEGLTLRYGGQTIHSHLVGAYNVSNIAAALAVARRFSVDLTDAARAIESYIPDNNRSQRRVTAHNHLVLDAYNANPSSMREALQNFIAHRLLRPQVVILGDMLELGVYAEAEHRAVLTQVEQGSVPVALLVGRQFSTLLSPGIEHEQGTTRFRSFTDVEQLKAYLVNHPLRDKDILLKGSRGIRLEQLLEQL